MSKVKKIGKATAWTLTGATMLVVGGALVAGTVAVASAGQAKQAEPVAVIALDYGTHGNYDRASAVDTATADRDARVAAEQARVAAEAAAAAESARVAAEQAAAAEAERIAAEQASAEEPPAAEEPSGPTKCPPGNLPNSGDGENHTSCFPEECFHVSLPDPAYPQCVTAFKP